MTVLVAGPRWAGVSSVAEALRERMPGLVITETCERPAAVVFVVSAVAPITASDRDLIHRACGYSELVVGAVSKIDAHRRWREVLAADRVLLAERGDRYRDVPWVGVAAAPDLGQPNVDDLVDVLVDGLADPDLAQRNRLRVKDTRVERLREHRSALVRSHRTAAPGVRVGVQAARVRLIFGVRKRCAQILVQLRESACQVGRAGAAGFDARVRAAADAFVGEVDAEIALELDAVAAGLALGAPGAADPPHAPEISDPRWRADRLQLRLTAVLGVGFGAGVALAASRLIVWALHGPDVAGLLAGGLLGAMAAAWVIRARGLLQYRAALDRWVGEVVVALRARGEELVTSRLLSAEAAFVKQLAAANEAHGARVAAVDAELLRLMRENSLF
jgi:hypothetical protein